MLIPPLTALRMGERGFHKRFQTVSCTNSLGFSMIKRTEIA